MKNSWWSENIVGLVVTGFFAGMFFALLPNCVWRYETEFALRLVFFGITSQFLYWGFPKIVWLFVRPFANWGKRVKNANRPSNFMRKGWGWTIVVIAVFAALAFFDLKHVRQDEWGVEVQRGMGKMAVVVSGYHLVWLPSRTIRAVPDELREMSVGQSRGIEIDRRTYRSLQVEGTGNFTVLNHSCLGKFFPTPKTALNGAVFGCFSFRTI